MCPQQEDILQSKSCLKENKLASKVDVVESIFILRGKASATYFGMHVGRRRRDTKRLRKQQSRLRGRRRSWIGGERQVVSIFTQGQASERTQSYILSKRGVKEKSRSNAISGNNSIHKPSVSYLCA